MGLGLVVVLLLGCEGTDDETTTTASPASQESTEPTPPPTSATVESVVATAQAFLDGEFAAAPPPEYLGPMVISCDRSGAVRAGDLVACIGTFQTKPGFELGSVGVVFAILDDSGTAAWTTGTDLPSNDAQLDTLVASATPGLFCRDLVDPEGGAGYFQATTTTEPSGYFLAVMYWFAEGRPDRMDADGNGTPCETIHDPEVVADVWAGGVVG